MIGESNYSISKIGNKNAEKYTEMQRDEVKYLFDILADNSTINIAKVTGYNLNFVNKTLSHYTIKKYLN